MKNVPTPQEECVSVKPAYCKHTFKEPTALLLSIIPLKPVSVRTRKCQNLDYVIVTYNLDDWVIHVVRWAAYHALKH